MGYFFRALPVLVEENEDVSGNAPKTSFGGDNISQHGFWLYSPALDVDLSLSIL